MSKWATIAIVFGVAIMVCVFVIYQQIGIAVGVSLLGLALAGYSRYKDDTFRKQQLELDKRKVE